MGSKYLRNVGVLLGSLMKKELGFLLFFSGAVLAAPSSPSREAREVELAERVILLSRLQFASPSVRHFCQQWQGLCVASESIELALAFMGRKETDASISVLVDIVRFRLDAGVGEDYTCYVLAHKDDGLRALKSVDAEKLHDRCLAEVSSMQSDARVSFADVEVTHVCSDSAFIRARIKELISAIEGGRFCNPADF